MPLLTIKGERERRRKRRILQETRATKEKAWLKRKDRRITEGDVEDDGVVSKKTKVEEGKEKEEEWEDVVGTPVREEKNAVYPDDIIQSIERDDDIEEQGRNRPVSSTPSPSHPPLDPYAGKFTSVESQKGWPSPTPALLDPESAFPYTGQMYHQITPAPSMGTILPSNARLDLGMTRAPSPRREETPPDVHFSDWIETSSSASDHDSEGRPVGREATSSNPPDQTSNVRVQAQPSFTLDDPDVSDPRNLLQHPPSTRAQELSAPQQETSNQDGAAVGTDSDTRTALGTSTAGQPGTSTTEAAVDEDGDALEEAAENSAQPDGRSGQGGSEVDSSSDAPAESRTSTGQQETRRVKLPAPFSLGNEDLEDQWDEGQGYPMDDPAPPHAMLSRPSVQDFHAERRRLVGTNVAEDGRQALPNSGSSTAARLPDSGRSSSVAPSGDLRPVPDAQAAARIEHFLRQHSPINSHSIPPLPTRLVLRDQLFALLHRNSPQSLKDSIDGTLNLIDDAVRLDVRRNYETALGKYEEAVESWEEVYHEKMRRSFPLLVFKPYERRTQQLRRAIRDWRIENDAVSFVLSFHLAELSRGSC